MMYFHGKMRLAAFWTLGDQRGSSTRVGKTGRFAPPFPVSNNARSFWRCGTEPRYSCAQFVLQGELHGAENDTGKSRPANARPRIGYTVTKKTGNSVERSRIKRRLKMAATKAVGQYGKPLEGEAVIVARRSAINEPFGSLVANLTKGIDRLLAKGKKAH